MTPHFQRDGLTIYNGHALEVLRALPSESVQCCVTSPPYFGLRKYSDSPHEIGTEETPALFVENLVSVFREVKRVLRKDGVAFLNLGDSYAGSGMGAANYPESASAKQKSNNGSTTAIGRAGIVPPGLKPKDLMMIPARAAIALQDDGWYLRSEIIWAKKNPMPEPVQDRPTSAHEKIYLLSKSAKYFYDCDAIKEPVAESTVGRGKVDFGGAKGRGYTPDKSDPNYRYGNEQWGRTFDYAESCSSGRNCRNVWELSSEPCREAHFATFPTEIPRRAILAGTSAHGACAVCGAAWARVVERETNWQERKANGATAGNVGASENYQNGVHGKGMSHDLRGASSTKGWAPSCKCDTIETKPCIALDPFLGSGTTAMVAQQLGRQCIGIELNPEYLPIIEKRIKADQYRLDVFEPTPEPKPTQLNLQTSLV